MLRAYAVDVLDRRVSPRRLGVLLDRMPAGAWTGQDPPAHTAPAESSKLGHPDNWSVEAHLLAELVDAIGWNTYVALLPHAKSRPPTPKPMPRPGRRGGASDGPKRMSITELTRTLTGSANGSGGG